MGLAARPVDEISRPDPCGILSARGGGHCAACRPAGRAILREKLTRTAMPTYFSRLAPMEVAIDAGRVESLAIRLRSHRSNAARTIAPMRRRSAKRRAARACASAVALANKMARIVWAMMSRGEAYRGAVHPCRSEPLGCREVRRQADDHRSIRQGRMPCLFLAHRRRRDVWRPAAVPILASGQGPHRKVRTHGALSTRFHHAQTLQLGARPHTEKRSLRSNQGTALSGRFPQHGVAQHHKLPHHRHQRHDRLFAAANRRR